MLATTGTASDMPSIKGPCAHLLPIHDVPEAVHKVGLLGSVGEVEGLRTAEECGEVMMM